MEHTENKEGYNLSFKKAWATPILRWILGIIILIIVFSFGAKFGEFKSFVRGGLGYGYSYSGSCPFTSGSYRNMIGTGNDGYYGMGPWMMNR